MQPPRNLFVSNQRRIGRRRGRLLPRTWAGLLAVSLAVGAMRAAEAQQPGSPEVGVSERIGTTVPLDVPLVDEGGKSVVLRDLVDRPTLLLFVYYRILYNPLLFPGNPWLSIGLPAFIIALMVSIGVGRAVKRSQMM